MKTIIFAAVEGTPLDRFELGEKAVVADLLRLLKERGLDVRDLLVFEEDHEPPLEQDHPLHAHSHPVFHVHRCRKIDVSIHYKADAFQHRFAPSTTIAAITDWAIKKARLGNEEAGEHVLQISGTRIQPPLNTHLGSLATHGCSASFDLVRKTLVQG